MMIVVTVNAPQRLPFGALAVWPFVFIRPELAADKALLAHEAVHLRRQARLLVLPWLVLYLVSWRFRLREEVLGHAEQIRRGGATVLWAAAFLKAHYRFKDVTEQQIAGLLLEELATTQ